MIGELSGLMTAVCWTGSSITFAAATMRVGSVYVNVVRLIMAAMILGVVLAFAGMLTDVTIPQLGYLAISGFMGLVFGDTFLFKSYEYNSPRISSLIMSTAPAFSAIIGYFFLGELLDAKGIIGMIVTLGGIGIVVLQQHEEGSGHHKIIMRGVVLALFGSLGQAIGLVLAKGAFVLGPLNGMVATFYRVLVGTITIIPLMMALGKFKKPVEVFRNDKRALKLTFAGSLFGPVFGITFSLIAVANTSIAVAATLIATVPIMMLPAARFIKKEHLTWQAIVGAVVSVAGVVILVWK